MMYISIPANVMAFALWNLSLRHIAATTLHGPCGTKGGISRVKQSVVGQACLGLSRNDWWRPLATSFHEGFRRVTRVLPSYESI